MSHSPAVRKKRRYSYVLLFVLFLTSYGYFFQGGGWNQNARICLTRGIVDYRTFAIDHCKEVSEGMEFANTGDWAYFNDHYYSNKSPGLSFLAVPSFAAAQFLSGYLFPGDDSRQILFSVYMSTLSTTAFFAALLCLLIFHLFNHFFRMSVSTSAILSLCFGFGTLAFSYSTTFYAHIPAACCAFLSFVLALHIRHGSSSRKKLLALMAGFSGATAVVLEPSTLFIVLAVLFYMVSTGEGRKYAFLFLVGCMPPGIVQGFYNFVCFGNPFTLSYRYANELVMWKVNETLFGIPSPQRVLKLLFSPYRGLFFSSPILLMALPGCFLFFKDKKWRTEAILVASVSLFFILFIAGFHGWHGGWTVGPRYLLPAYPWFFLLAGFSLTSFPRLFKVIALLSVLVNLSITIVGNEIPLEVKNPLGEVVFKKLISGHVSINPFPLSHCENYNIYDLAQMDSWQPNFNSFNLGEFLFPHSLVSILPLICFWIIWGYWWKRHIRALE